MSLELESAVSETLYLEQLLSDKENWSECPAGVQSCLSSILEVLKLHSNAFHRIEEVVDSKVSRHKVQSELTGTGSVSGLSASFQYFQTTIENKLSQKLELKDIQQLLLNKTSFSDVRALVEDKVTAVSMNNEIGKVHKQLDIVYGNLAKSLQRNPQRNELEEVLQSLGNRPTYQQLQENIKLQVSRALDKIQKKKPDRTELTKKADLSEVQSLAGGLEAVYSKITQVEVQLSRTKNDKRLKEWGEKWAQKVQWETEKKLDQFVSFLSETDKKIEQVNRKFSLLNRKLGISRFEESVKGLREELLELTSEGRIQFMQAKDEAKSVTDELSYAHKQLKDQVEDIKTAYGKSYENYELNCTMNSEIREEIYSEINSKMSLKAERSELEDAVSSLTNAKADISELETTLIAKNKELVKLLQGLATEFQSHISSLKESLEKKIEAKIVDGLTAIDCEPFRSERITSEILENLTEDVRFLKSQCVPDIQSLELNQNLPKAPYIRGLCGLIDSKADLEDVNQTFSRIQREIDQKADNWALTEFEKEYDAVADTLCSEICLGRWQWRAGSLSSASFILWDHESINTNSDLFIWEKNSIFIMLNEEGVYECNFALFTDSELTYELLLNGVEILSRTIGNAPNSAFLFKERPFLLDLSRNSRLSVKASKQATGILSLKRL